MLHAISPISIKLWQSKGSAPKFKKTKWFLFCFFPGGYRIYDALTAMVVNQLLWESAHILLHPELMCDASISQFNLRLVNQQRQINDCVFRRFDSSKYLTTLRSTIPPCQKAVTLILISFYNLWKPSKKYLGTTEFFSWMPFKICDCDKFLSITPVTQFWLSLVTWPNEPTFFSSSYKMIDQRKLKNVKNFRDFS